MIGAVTAAAAAGLAGGVAQAATGFGFALVAVPLLALAATPHDAVVAVTAASAAMSSWAAWRERREVDRVLTTRICLAAIVGMPAGLAALILAPQRVLAYGVAGVALAFLAWTLAGRTVRPGRATVLGAGLIGGAALTSTGMNGPPIVAALHALRMPVRRQRATLQAVFCLQDIVAVAAFAALGQTSSRVWLYVLCAVPGAVLGWFAGDVLFRRMDERAARALITALLLASTVALVVTAGG
ncbi:MAG: sulfite exporter TauE/SafE family protein [Jatrophihabitans sp.]|nr:MAG: sulfite exporter TauE/SafE family protein [Jatrophihabitans sp.]